MFGTPKHPERLWKYKPWDDYTKRMVIDGELYFASKQQLNDPFEFHWCDRFPTKLIEIDYYVREFCSKFFPNDSAPERRLHYLSVKEWIEHATRRNKSGIVPTAAVLKQGVCCLSEIHTDILMWSHYALSHQGVCVSVLTDHLSKKLILPVTYSDDIPVIDAWDYINHNRMAFVNVSLRKSPHWSYEKEWRTIDFVGPKLFPGIVDQIVIGSCVSDATRADILAVAAQADHSIKILEAKMSDMQYKLHIRPLSA